MPASIKTVFFHDRLIGSVKKEVVKPFMTLIGVEYTNMVKKLMRDSPRSGRIYKRGKKQHRASAPGEPPAIDTGDLVKSIRFNVTEKNGLAVMEAGSTKKKALYLEYGAAKLSERPPRVRRKRKQTGKEAKWILFPRPAWGPAMAMIKRRMPALMAKASRMRKK